MPVCQFQHQRLSKARRIIIVFILLSSKVVLPAIWLLPTNSLINRTDTRHYMDKQPEVQEPISITLRRHPHGDKREITDTVRWVAFVALFLFLVLIIISLLEGFYANAFVSAIGIVPILISILMLKRDEVSLPSTILAVTIILLITCLSTLGNGLHDIGVLGYIVILIVAGLILRGKVIIYLAFFTIGCVGWLAFGEYFGWFKLSSTAPDPLQDFFIGSIIILIAGNTIYRLANNVFDNLDQAEKEIETRKKAEQERESVIKRLKAKNQELDRFAIRVSHDLKSPLITLAGFLGFLERDLKDDKREQAQKDMAQINEAAKRMGKFVDELLDLSRVGRIVNKPTNVAFDDILREALEVTEGVLQAKQAQVKIEAIFPFVYVDRSRVVQVLQNLITNAVKFSRNEEPPIIRFGFEEIDGEHIFSVGDNGIGIARAHQEQIFELFSKLNPDIEGTGIGLGLVKRIVEVHEGRIWVESEVGRGATFKFTLARAPKTKR